MIKKINIGIIGCSNIANDSIIPAIQKSKYANLIFIGSRNKNKAKQFASKFKCKNFGTYEDVLSSSNVDAVYISTPIGLHEKWVLESAKAKKHVLCEKSSTTSFKSAEKMVHTTQKNNVRLMEGLMFKYHPSHKLIKKFIKKNIGNLFSFYSQYGFPHVPKSDIRYKKKLGGGVFNDAACYPICASRLIFEKEPKEIFTSLQIDKKFQVDTKASVFLKFNEGEIAHGTVGYELEYQNFYSVWGKKGFLKISRAYNIPSNMKPKISITTQHKTFEHFAPLNNHFLEMINNFVQICTNTKIIFNEEKDLLLQALIMEYGRKSAHQNRLLKINYPKILK
ncbi:MAG: dehydrogenase [Thaumarchaeota archaeon]|nr:MAG: dehydrogenase [Nitrososphaerota archaeon]